MYRNMQIVGAVILVVGTLIMVYHAIVDEPIFPALTSKGELIFPIGLGLWALGKAYEGKTAKEEERANKS